MLWCCKQMEWRSQQIHPKSDGATLQEELQENASRCTACVCKVISEQTIRPLGQTGPKCRRSKFGENTHTSRQHSGGGPRVRADPAAAGSKSGHGLRFSQDDTDSSYTQL